MKIFQVLHIYDVDRGFGDALPVQSVVATFESEEDALKFVEKFSNRHVYEKPYAELECGFLRVEPMDIISHREFNLDAIDTESFWWLDDDGGWWHGRTV